VKSRVSRARSRLEEVLGGAVPLPAGDPQKLAELEASLRDRRG
jgi:hypothetical protein